MREKLLIIFLLNCLAGQVITNNSFNNSKSIALAGTTVSSPGGIENIINNPANLSSVRGTSFIISNTIFYERDDFLNYQYYSILYHPDRKTNLSLTVQNLGTKAKGAGTILSSEKAITLSHGFTLFKDRNSSLRLGYNANYLLLEQGRSAGVSGDGSDGLSGSNIAKIGLDVGIWASLRGKVTLGAFIKNINSPRIGRGSSAQFLPRKLNIGFSYFPIERLITSFSYERLLGSTSNHFRFGIEFEFHKYFTLRTGIQMKPNRLGFGFISSINDKSSFAYGLITHPILPLTHNAEIGFYF